MLYSRANIRVSQCTLSEPIHYRGIGLRGRREVNLSLLPAPAGSGLHILRRDVDVIRGLITPEWRNVVETHPCTVLANEHGVSVSGVEPLLAALRGCGVDNALIEVSGHEIPVFDGSCAPLVAMINRAGVVAQGMARYGIWIDDFVAVRYGEQYAFIEPAAMPAISLDISRENDIQSLQPLSLNLVDHVFESEIAPARNPAAGELADNRVYRSEPRPAEPGQSRFADEAARYRVAECLGLLALAEAPIFGHFYFYNPGNFVVHKLLSELAGARNTWRMMSYAKINQLAGGAASRASQQQNGTGGTGITNS